MLLMLYSEFDTSDDFVCLCVCVHACMRAHILACVVVCFAPGCGLLMTI